ncbi:permease for cytosine/purines, uracil, thiamine, allantoin-domain-containing protein [Exophiala viscosa]|uniref:permease for cytosine/purines, uracil, thiamine, allantoin-domain-containing protein n=1 Tax=Exophiala viscosa TaxID=2486360 RepID=UPI002195B0A5|nr:permease for cytosine/purines, uracil, thiamine, allantoin-domain-containing protein [Exophiala viscosa]
MGRRETFWGIPLPNHQQWKENFITVKNTKGFKNKLHVSHEMVKLDPDGSIFANGTSWANKVPPEQRKWRAWDFMTYWASDQFTIPTWEFGSSMVAQGFTLPTLQVYGETYWSPAEILAQWDNRAAVFFAALDWIIATIGVNLSANTVTIAIALSSFSPKYINNVRGCWLVALLSIIIVPWKIVNNGGSFINFLSAYPSLLGPISGIIMSDYWLVRQRKVDVRHLYIGKGGKYFYWHGVNWRAIAAYIAAYAPNLPGFIHQINPNVPDVQPYTYDLSWVFAVIISASVFWGLNFVFPPSYSLSGPAVHPDDVVDWVARNRIGDLDEDSVDGTVVDTPEKVAEFPPKHQIAVSLPEQEKQV